VSQASKIILLSAVIGIILAGYVLYEFHSDELPKLEQSLVASTNQVNQLETELKRVQGFASNLVNIKKELKELTFQWEAAVTHMPRQFDLSVLLRRLSGLAQSAGVEMFAFRPAITATTPGHQPAVAKDPNKMFYDNIDIECELSGAFSQVLSFMDQVIRLKRIVNFEKVSLNMAPSSKNRSGLTKIKARAVLRTYRFAE